MTGTKKLDDCQILVAECEAVRQAIIAAIKMGRRKVYIQSDSQIVLKAVNGKMAIPKDFINLVEDIRWSSSYFKAFVWDYCYRNEIEMRMR